MRSDPIRHCSQLSRRGEKILIALLEHPTHEKAAAAAGISPVTLWRWLKNPKFQKALAAARRDVYSQSMARIHQATAAAAATVVRTMVDPNAKPELRLRAAQMVLDNVSRSLEHEDIECRLRELERSASQKEPSQMIRKLTTFGQQQELNELDQEESSNDETDRKAA